MLNTINVPLGGRMLASLTVSENGLQDLTISVLASPIETATVQLERSALMRLALLLSEAIHFHDRGLLLSASMVYEGKTAEQIARDREAVFQLPF